MAVLKVKAGRKLLEVLKGTVSTNDSPDEVTQPFSNAMFRLKKHFESISDVMLYRRRLATMNQSQAEGDKVFIQRAVVVAKLCGYSEDQQFDEILSAVAVRAYRERVRAEAVKWMNRKAKNPNREGLTLQDFIDKIRELETIRLNEDYVSMQRSGLDAAPLAVNAVRAIAGPSRGSPGLSRGSANKPFASSSRYSANRFSSSYGRMPRTNTRGGRTMQLNREILRRGEDPLVPDRCKRCNSIFHSEQNCFAAQMVCYNCGQTGHLVRACPLPLAPRNRRPSTDRTQHVERILAITDAKPEVSEENSDTATKSVSEV